MGLAADFAGALSLIDLELGEVAHLELNNPPMNLVTDELLDAARSGTGDARDLRARQMFAP